MDTIYRKKVRNNKKELLSDDFRGQEQSFVIKIVTRWLNQG